MKLLKSSQFFITWQAIAISARDIEEKGIFASTEKQSLENKGDLTFISEENDILTSATSSALSPRNISVRTSGSNVSTLFSEGDDASSIVGSVLTSYERTGRLTATLERRLKKRKNKRLRKRKNKRRRRRKNERLRKRKNNRIIGGSIAPINRYTYMTELYPKPGCGASLIHPRVLLTAAHCLYKQDRVSNASIGIHTRDKHLKNDQFETIAIRATYIHPSYKDYSANVADVALLLLSKASSMTPVRLSEKKVDSKPGTTVTAMGWGQCSMSHDCSQTYQLKHATLQMLSLKSCRDYFGKHYRGSKYICARDSAKKNVDCYGDSGGPIIVRGEKPSDDIQVGIVSYGPDNCLLGPSAYANIVGLRKWIENTMRVRWKLTLGDGLQSPACKDKGFKSCANLRTKSLKIRKVMCKESPTLTRACRRTCGMCRP